MDKIIKTLAQVMCPHCSTEFTTSFRTMAPAIDWALKSEDIKAIKEDLIARVKILKFKNEEDKRGVLEWLNSDGAAVGPGEVELILEQIKSDYVA